MLPIATLDLETDPFEHGKTPQPFVSGYYDGVNFSHIWSEESTIEGFWHRDEFRFVERRKCIQDTIKMLGKLPPHQIYIHNGGRFDLYFFLDHLNKGSIKIINHRIVECGLPSANPNQCHIIRDSYAILPIPLRVYDKDEISYELMRPENRNSHKEEILRYLKKDCTALYKLVTKFHEEFQGNKLTIGSTAMKKLKEHHSFDSMNSFTDATFREKYFLGGRNQVFKSGIYHDDVKIYDVNSMYPYVMKNYLHPVGSDFEMSKKITPSTCFIEVKGMNHGAFPQRTKNGIDFTTEYGTYYVSIHEYEAALETKTFEPTRIIKCFNFYRRENFAEFVDQFFNARLQAKLDGDKIHDIFYKLILNSAYGKFAQNGDNFFDWQIFEYPNCPTDWIPAFIWEHRYILAKKKTKNVRYNNVATGASITGAARSYLLRSLAKADTPYYCDTDSIICRNLNVTNISESELGAWKLERSGNKIAIAGKKNYVVYLNGEEVKLAHKGSKLTGPQIEEVADGSIIQYLSEAPCFQLDGTTKFVKRKIKRTSHV